jgi:hypothetical protein
MDNFSMIPSYQGGKRNESSNELGNLSEFSLFDLNKDLGQNNNVAKENPQKMEQMKKCFFEITKGFYCSGIE